MYLYVKSAIPSPMKKLLIKVKLEAIIPHFLSPSYTDSTYIQIP